MWRSALRNAKRCASAVIVREGRVLLGRRAGEPGRGQWDIPGGFLNPWEHPADGAMREVREETGLEVQFPWAEGGSRPCSRDEIKASNVR